MVTVPVKLYGATEEKRVAFHQVHAADGGRVRQKRVCELDGQEVPLSDVAKGYQLPDGDVVVLTDKDFEGLPEAVAKTISVESFVPEEQIDPIMYSRSYYLAPDKLGVRPYALLRDAMESSGRVAVVRFAMRERETLAALRVRDGVLVLETMLWSDEIRKPDFDFLDKGAKVEPKPAELKMAELLIDSLSTDFHPEDYHDTYREALEEVIEAKVAGREVVTPPSPAEGGAQVIDLMAALKASVEAAKKTRGAGEGIEAASAAAAGAGTAGGARSAAAPAAAAPAKKTAAKKTTTSKSSATPKRAAKGARATAKTQDPHDKPARKKSTSTRRSA
jgi:DNA end-binding protein Ku